MIYGLRLALILLAIAVVAGAFGAHALRDVIDERLFQAWQTGVLYHFLHALGVVAVTLVLNAEWMDPRKGKWVVRFHVAGILLFSGSLYGMALGNAAGVDLSFLGPLTPIGGLSFVAGWMIAAISVSLPVLRD